LASLGLSAPHSDDEKTHSYSSTLISDITLSSNIEKVIQLLNNYQDGTLKEPWTEVPLRAGDYECLKTLLERDEDLFRYANDKIRYENHLTFEHEFFEIADRCRYDFVSPGLSLVIRKPTCVHELIWHV
jgi:hypothetical protein